MSGSRKLRQLVVLAVSFFVALEARADQLLPSKVPGLQIGNAYIVLQGQGLLVRGSAPVHAGKQLKTYGITDVLIFKNQTGGEINAEMADLKTAGFAPKSVVQIPYQWKILPSFQAACEQLIDALTLLDTVYRTKGRKAFFHCTVGEDRTGMLAGLIRLLEKGEAVAQVFQQELCARGYEAGDPNKPDGVNQIIRQILTPMYVKMGGLIRAGKIKSGALSKAV
jgi:hypothetical protein